MQRSPHLGPCIRELAAALLPAAPGGWPSPTCVRTCDACECAGSFRKGAAREWCTCSNMLQCMEPRIQCTSMQPPGPTADGATCESCPHVHADVGTYQAATHRRGVLRPLGVQPAPHLAVLSQERFERVRRSEAVRRWLDVFSAKPGRYASSTHCLLHRSRDWPRAPAALQQLTERE